MPQTLLERWKPAARSQTHLLAAALLWTIVGSGLTAAGVIWCAESPWPWWLALIALGYAIGHAKARWVLSHIAHRNAQRIVTRGDGRCLGGFVSWQSWGLVGFMMAGGYLLRHSPIPLPILAVIYTAVGTALLIASLTLWSHRRRIRQ